LEEVVRMRRWVLRAGPERREERAEVRSAIVEVEGMGRQRVVGRPRPGKDVRRMLIIVGGGEAMVSCLC
jgi:hypothetical protein